MSLPLYKSTTLPSASAALPEGSKGGVQSYDQWYICRMRYLVKARVKPGKGRALLKAIAEGTLGQGSVAGDEYQRNMQEARLLEDGTVKWVEICFCREPLEEERAYWEEFFDLLQITDAHARSNCRHENGTEPWACSDCNCTEKLERRLRSQGDSFLK